MLSPRLPFCICIFLLVSLRALAGDSPRTVRAVRITIPPRTDGILDEDVWKQAQPATDFIQRDPDEGMPASEQSEIRVLYDDNALYFGCMFYDSEPDRIVARMTRRDNEIESDRASVRIDSYHDHHTGYEFTFNAAGVKVDILQYDDALREDESWDPVWDVSTAILPDGWSAELKIPFRTLRYRSGDELGEEEWGINFIRYISRKQETARWAFTPKRETGIISRYGHLVGLNHLPTSRQLEVLPFVVGRQSFEPASAIRDRRNSFLGEAGLDLRYGVTSNSTLDVTVNPDFGQVEADPAVLNLSTLETFYPEKRPFFIEGTQIVRFTTFGGEFGPGMFYSRRIGRAISINEANVPGGGRIESIPQSVTILGAGKFTGKTSRGFSFGVLEALTEEERSVVVDSGRNRSEQVIEPLAHYNVVRLKQDVLDGSFIGTILTSVAKRSRYPAFTNGYDWLLRFDKNTYQLDGFLALSHTTGANDERVTGSAGKVQFSRIAGEHWVWTVSGDFTSKRYNINDVGFFFRPNDWGSTVILGYKEDKPAQVVRNYQIALTLFERRNFDGASLAFLNFLGARGARLATNTLFTNYWSTNASLTYDIGGFDDLETRGNGLYRVPKRVVGAWYLFSDRRQHIVGKLGLRFGLDTKSYRQGAVEAGVELKPVSWMEYKINADIITDRGQEAWVNNIAVGNSLESIFADRSTEQYNLTVRSTITFTRDLTLQLYSQVFLAKGHHENHRQLVGTADFSPFDYPSHPDYRDPDFNSLSLNLNLVLRWEYLPGSTMFLVWSQARNGGSSDYFTSFGQNFGDTFRIAPHNVILLKMSYFWSL